MYDIIELNGKLVSELRDIAKQLNIPKVDKLLKQDLIYKILDHQALNPTEEVLQKEKKEAKKTRGKRARIAKVPENKKPAGSKEERPQKAESKPAPKETPKAAPKAETPQKLSQ